MERIVRKSTTEISEIEAANPVAKMLNQPATASPSQIMLKLYKAKIRLQNDMENYYRSLKKNAFQTRYT